MALAQAVLTVSSELEKAEQNLLWCLEAGTKLPNPETPLTFTFGGSTHHSSQMALRLIQRN